MFLKKKQAQYSIISKICFVRIHAQFKNDLPPIILNRFRVVQDERYGKAQWNKADKLWSLLYIGAYKSVQPAGTCLYNGNTQKSKKKNENTEFEQLRGHIRLLSISLRHKYQKKSD